MITDVVEFGGYAEATDTVVAKYTGQTFSNGIPGEFGEPYTVRTFAEDAPAFVDRPHQWNGATTAGLPAYLVGGEYILIGNDNRTRRSLRLDVTVSAACDVYLLVDNRLFDADGATPPEHGVVPEGWNRMPWVGWDGYEPVRTGLNRTSDASRPDEVGVDEGGDGTGAGVSVQNYSSIYRRTVPAGTFRLGEMIDGTRNMYGVVVVAAQVGRQGILWNDPSRSTILHPEVPVTLEATASSGLAVSFRVESGPATIENGQVTCTGPGSIALVAEQGGNGTYGSATLRRVFNRPQVRGRTAAAWPGHPRGGVLDVEVQGMRAFLAAGSGGLTEVSFSVPSKPVRTGGVPSYSESRAVVLAGNVAYLADLHAGVQVVDTRTPGRPVVLTTIDTPGQAKGLALAGGLLCVADGTAGLTLLDVSAPGEPRQVGSLATGGDASGVGVQGNLVMLADGEAGLRVIDIANPAAPALLGTYDTSGWAEGLAIFGSVTFVADGASGVQVISTANPAAPVRVGGWDTSGTARSVKYLDGRLYVADDAAGVVVLDASNPLALGLAGTFATEGRAMEIAPTSGGTYVAGGLGGVQLLNLSNPASPALTGSLRVDGNAQDVAVEGSLAVLADGEAGLRIFDVNDPKGPNLLATYPSGGSAVGVLLHEGRAYLADGYAGLKVVDVRQPGQPTLEGALEPGGFAHGVARTGDRLWLAADWVGLKAVDITNPAAPRVEGGYDTEGVCLGVAVAGDRAFVADGFPGVQVVDVGDVSNMTRLANIDTPLYASGVAVSGDYLYVADSGLSIYDVSVPSAPVLLGRWPGGNDVDVSVVDGIAYLVGGGDGVQILDVRDPRLPVRVGRMRTPGRNLATALSGNHLYTAESAWGLRVSEVFRGVPQEVDFWLPVALAVDASPLNLSAEASSGLPVTFSVVAGPATVSGDRLDTTAVGEVRVRADQAGNEFFLPATAVARMHAGKVIERPGLLRFEAWHGLTPDDEALDDGFSLDPVDLRSPDEVGYVSAFDSRHVYSDDRRSGYLGRLSGYLVPPTTGSYRFFVTSDDASRLFVGAAPGAEALESVAEGFTCCSGFVEPEDPSVSAPKGLEAAGKYRVEGEWKEARGGDYLRVGWRKEGDPTPASGLPVLAGTALGTWVPNDDPPELTLTDPSANLTGDTALTFLDIVSVSVQIDDGRYRLEMETAGVLPSPSALGPDRRIDYIWFVDADRNSATGQFADGNDYNIHAFLDATGWHWRWYRVSSLSANDGVNFRSEDIEVGSEGSRVFIAFPAYYFPLPSFDLWGWAQTGSSVNWSPFTRTVWTSRGTADYSTADTQAPSWIALDARFGANRLLLTFDDILDVATAADTNRYRVGGSYPVQAILQDGQRSVELVVESLAQGWAPVEVEGVKDFAGNAVSGVLARTIALRLEEDFEDLDLGPNFEEPLVLDRAWTHVPPTGWGIDNGDFVATRLDPDSQPPNVDADGDGYPDLDGRTEWAGWSFANRDWWAQSAGQRRSEFLLGTGTIAVADPDEWDDGPPHLPSFFHSRLSMPAIDVSGIGGDAFRLSFNSSWRPEAYDDADASRFPVGPSGEAVNNQTGIITAVFDGTTEVEVLRWDSDPSSPYYHDHRVNERVFVPIPIPSGASRVVLDFTLRDAANDWWWAIDDVEVAESRVAARVVGRHAFYNDSVFDGRSPSANAADDDAIAIDKSALLPGGAAAFVNYTSYNKGLNGIMVDVANLHGEPTTADFLFRAGNSPDTSSWPAAPEPTDVAVRRGAGVGGSDRVTLIWTTGTVSNRWLQITVAATPAVGLADSDVFYFGNAVGETGNSTQEAKVTSVDALRILSRLTSSASVTNAFDVNRDGRVGSGDRLVVLNNLSALSPLELIDLGPGGGMRAQTDIAPSAAVVGTFEKVGDGLVLRYVEDDRGSLVWTRELTEGAEWEVYQTLRPGSDVLEALPLPIDPDEPGRIYRIEAPRAPNRDEFDHE